MFELLGIVGIAISMLAYLPQVVHLAREHCSAGVSRRAWAMWLVSSLLIGALALHRHDIVFILLQISSLTSATIILFLAQRYRGMVCEAHALRFQPLNHIDWPAPAEPHRRDPACRASSASRGRPGRRPFPRWGRHRRQMGRDMDGRPDLARRAFRNPKERSNPDERCL